MPMPASERGASPACYASSIGDALIEIEPGLCAGPAQCLSDADDRHAPLRRGVECMAQQVWGASIAAG
jgi:hypothetical protein